MTAWIILLETAQGNGPQKNRENKRKRGPQKKRENKEGPQKMILH